MPDKLIKEVFLLFFLQIAGLHHFLDVAFFANEKFAEFLISKSKILMESIVFQIHLANQSERNDILIKLQFINLLVKNLMLLFSFEVEQTL